MKKLLLLLLLCANAAAQSVVSTTVPVSTNMVLLGKGTNFFNVNSNLFATTARNYVDLPNMAALRALPITYLVNGVGVNLLGYYQPGDGGGGIYVLTNSLSGTNAYGGRIVALGGTKSWQLENDYADINPLQFGAVGDGVTDSHAAMQAAIEYAKPIRGMIRFRPGTYITSKSLMVTDGGGFSISGQPLNNANAAADGASRFRSQVYIRLANGANTNVLWITTNAQVTIDGVNFDGNRNNQTVAHPVLYINTGPYPIVQVFNCNFLNGSGHGAYIENRYETTFVNSKFLFNNLDGMYVTNSVDLYLTKCHFGFNRGSGLTLRTCFTFRVHEVDTYLNQNQGMDINNFYWGFVEELVSNNNGREALKIQNTGTLLHINKSLLTGGNNLVAGSTIGGWTNAFPTGTFPLLGFYDDGPDNPNGVYQISLNQISFNGSNGSLSAGLPSYTIGDFRTNAFAKNGFGIFMDQCFLPSLNNYTTALFTTNFPGRASIKGILRNETNGFVTTETVFAQNWQVLGTSNVFIGFGSNVFAVVNPTTFGTNNPPANTTNFYVDTISGRTYVQGLTTDPPTDPAYPTGTTFVVKNNRLTTDRARIALVGGSAGITAIDFGPTGLSQIQYDEVNDRLRFLANGSEGLRLKNQQVAMGSGTASDPITEAAVEIQSTAKGFRLPQLTGADVPIININSPDGLMWYRTDLSEFRVRATNETRILAQRYSTISTNIDFPSLTTLQSTSTNVSYNFANVGDYVLLTPTQPNPGLIATADVTGLGVVTITLNNVSSGTIDLNTNTFKITIVEP